MVYNECSGAFRLCILASANGFWSYRIEAHNAVTQSWFLLTEFKDFSLSASTTLDCARAILADWTDES